MLAPEAQRLRLRRVQLTVVASSLRWVATPDEGEELEKHAQFASFCIPYVLTHPFASFDGLFSTKKIPTLWIASILQISVQCATKRTVAKTPLLQSEEQSGSRIRFIEKIDPLILSNWWSTARGRFQQGDRMSLEQCSSLNVWRNMAPRKAINMWWRFDWYNLTWCYIVWLQGTLHETQRFLLEDYFPGN